jgi:hypothetical protein
MPIQFESRVKSRYFACQQQTFHHALWSMKILLAGIAYLSLTLGTGCGGDKSDVENSPSAATTLKQSEEAARKGDAYEMMNVGMANYRGYEDVPQDNVSAYIWLMLAKEDEELKDAEDLRQALADLNQTLTDADKANARSQMKAIRAKFPASN